MSRPTARTARRAARPLAGAAALLAVAVQLVVLYVPTAPGTPLVPGADKVVHLLVFAVPVLLLLVAGVPAPLVVTVFAVHAGVSEAVQGAWLPDRSGDLGDVLADLAGVALGWGLWRLVGRRGPSTRW